MLALILLVVGILFRVIGHFPNFTPVISLVLFGAIFLRKRYALWLPIVLMAVSDLFLGFHSIMFFTWGSLLLVSLWGRIFRDKISIFNIAFSSLGGAIIFFVISNFGAWLSMYPKTFAGLMDCYVMAIPFFRQTLFSTFIYSYVIVGIYVFACRRIKSTRLAWVIR